MKTFSPSNIIPLLTLICSPLCLATQPDLSPLDKAIESSEVCNAVALTQNSGSLVIHDGNAYTILECPETLENDLATINQKEQIVADVTLTEKGSYAILTEGGDVYISDDLPEGLEDAIDQFMEKDEDITCISFNDKGDWVIVSKESFHASNKDLETWIEKGMKEHGDLWSVTLTDSAAVAVMSNGYLFEGDVPKELIEEVENNAEKEDGLDIFSIKWSGHAWFMIDHDGACIYNF